MREKYLQKALSNTFRYLHICKIQVFIESTFDWELTKDFDNPEIIFPK